MNASARLNLSYIAPGNSAASLALSATLAYVSSAVGFLDVPDATADGTAFVVPFGTVGAPKLVALQNNTTQAVEVSINTSEDVWTLGAGDLWVVGGPTALGITAISVLTTALTTEQGTVSYVVLGDDVDA